jgi:DNA-binding XRE family transcriptional regulator
VKPSDSRSKSFIARGLEPAAQLEAILPDTLSELLRDAIEDTLDMEMLRAAQEREAQECAEVQKKLDEVNETLRGVFGLEKSRELRRPFLHSSIPSRTSRSMILFVGHRRQRRERRLKAIKVLRGERGMTATALAREAGISREQLSRIENGHYEPGAPTMKSIADVLGVQVRDIYMLEEAMNAPKAPAREQAGAWLESKVNHSYLALPDHGAVEVVKDVSSLDEIDELKHALDIEKDVAQSFLEHHVVEPRLREGLQECTRKHLHWLIDLEKRRNELRATGRDSEAAGFSSPRRKR